MLPGLCPKRSEHVGVSNPLTAKPGSLECRSKRDAIVHSPVGPLSPRTSASVCPYEKSPLLIQHPADFGEALVELLLVHVLEHVVQDDEIEGASAERELPQGRDAQIDLGYSAAREVDRLWADVHS